MKTLNQFSVVSRRIDNNKCGWNLSLTTINAAGTRPVAVQVPLHQDFQEGGHGTLFTPNKYIIPMPYPLRISWLSTQ